MTMADETATVIDADGPVGNAVEPPASAARKLSGEQYWKYRALQAELETHKERVEWYQREAVREQTASQEAYRALSQLRQELADAYGVPVHEMIVSEDGFIAQRPAPAPRR
jgi:hypothetical protein